jgi:acetyl esterase
MTVRYQRPALRLHERVRRRIGAAITDGFFKGAANGARYLPVAHPRIHGVEVLRDQPYTSSGGEHHLLDVWRPANRSGAKLPVVLYLHGGGFRFLSKDTHWVFGLVFARRGFLVCNINYRLAPEHPYPAAIEDACAAYKWVVENAERLGGDPNQIVLAGESAGANLSTSVALATSYRRPEPFAREIFELGVQPKAVVPACGLFQVSDPERFGLKSKYFWDRIAEVTDAYLHGAEIAEGHGLDLADPVVALEKGHQPERPLPPFFIPAGGWDVIQADGPRLAEALRALGAKAEAKIYPRGFHAFHAFVLTPSALRCWRDTFAFIDESLRR